MKVFSIIIPSYNSAEFIKENLESVLNQSFNDFEVIVIDNESTDQTIEIIENMKDKRIKIISERDNGIYDAMNKGISLARGKFVHILNSDDKYTSSKVLQNVFSAFQSDPSIELVYGGIRYISRFDRKISHIWMPSQFSKFKLKIGWHPPHPGVFVKRGVYKRSGHFNTIFGVTGDYDWLLRVFNDDKTKSTRLDTMCVDMSSGGASDRNSLIKLRGLQAVYRIHKKFFSSSFLAFLAVSYRIISKLVMKNRGILRNG